MLLAASAQATTLTVNSTPDAGGTCPGADCTLRQAIASAASTGDTINFGLPANSAITLSTGELLINKSLTISGPGANLLTVQRSSAPGTSAFRIFDHES
jgi:CSLREA domain-containing protein